MRYRTLPDFIIIGAQKSGTSSLYSYLSQHPQLVPSFKKELHFFDGGLHPDVDNFEKGEAWYRAHFFQKRNTSDNRKAFEATPSYIFNPLAPQRISELIPEVKLIAVLRNPRERAISHYFHETRRDREPLPIMEAFQAEEERLRPLIAKQDYKNEIFIHKSYKSRGLYHKQIKRYLDYFPMSNILVINSETLFQQPDDTLRRVFQFIGVDAGFTVKNLKPSNMGTNKAKIDPDVYEYLEDYFRPHDEELYELIGQNFGW
ncbi:sulfotransferase domain-containing protein [Gloeothece citriformis]|uniref:sulfotransferase domain-containing protein n=1 Tax=Gloeothece citriformis TaxID=2546356 RepID=UPI0012FEC798|nr:sulfotransferase domain-containing protein [Gloeothece citriformis]